MDREKGVFQFTSNHGRSGNISFHMPGHKGSHIYTRFGYGDFLKDFPNRDITEISGADNLFQAESIIAETMEKYRELYGVSASYLLINGSSGGLIASMMACASPGESIIVARNCHKAVFNALRLGDIKPVYAYAEMIAEYGIAGAMDPVHVEQLVRENPDAKAIILPSPNYYGICSDIQAIARIAHDAGMKLIVDQAHGAHLRFFEESCPLPLDRKLSMPRSAESSGADFVINSTHKTLASMTQSAVLNVCTGSGSGECSDPGSVGEPTPSERFIIEDRLQMIQSTSPSYILMESLDINADILREHGRELIDEWYENLGGFYAEAEKIPGLKIMEIPGMDHTKINLDMSSLGYDGAALEAELIKRGIYPELTTGNILMCMSGIGNGAGDYQKLLSALRDISSSNESGGEDPAAGLHRSGAGEDPAAGNGPWVRKRELCSIPRDSRLIGLDEAAGMICASSIIPYPPGIPLICPGEVISREDIDYIKTLRGSGEKVIGVDPLDRISVGRKD